MPPILEVKNLVKKYGDFTAVKGISFDIKEGEIFSLLGPNGAGKTTTISMLSTLYVPTSGEASVGGHSVTKEPMAVRNLIGELPRMLENTGLNQSCRNLLSNVKAPPIKFGFDIRYWVYSWPLTDSEFARL